VEVREEHNRLYAYRSSDGGQLRAYALRNEGDALADHGDDLWRIYRADHPGRPVATVADTGRALATVHTAALAWATGHRPTRDEVRRHHPLCVLCRTNPQVARHLCQRCYQHAGRARRSTTATTTSATPATAAGSSADQPPG